MRSLRSVPSLSAGCALALAACAGSPAPAPGPATPAEAAAPAVASTALWTLAPSRAACVGVAPMECLQYRDAPGGPWKLHHGEIEGFELRPGDEVDLEVRFEAVARPPADGPSARTVFVRELARRTLPGAPLPAALLGTGWRLDAMPGSAVGLAGLQGAPSLAFEAPSRASGNAGVNRFGAELEVGEGWVRVGPPMSTRMAGPPEAMALEAEFLGRLKRAGLWRVHGERLRLLDAGGAEFLSLHREAPSKAP